MAGRKIIVDMSSNELSHCFELKVRKDTNVKVKINENLATVEASVDSQLRVQCALSRNQNNMEQASFDFFIKTILLYHRF